MNSVGQARIENTEAELRASQTPESQGSVNPMAPLKAVVGPVEHPGRVRGMGLGARPSMVYPRQGSSSAPGPSGSRRPPAGDFEAIIAEKVAEQVAAIEAARRADEEARNRRRQESIDRWWERHSSNWTSVCGVLNKLCPDTRLPSPEPPPPFLFDDSSPRAADVEFGKKDDPATSGC